MADRIFIVKDTYAGFLADALAEMSKNEHCGIKNMLILAVSGNDEPMLMTMNGDLYSLEAMLSYGMGYFGAKESLFDKAIYDSIVDDSIPEEAED